MLHESTKAAAKRRLKYELGISGVDLHLALPDFRYRAEKGGVMENEICPVFVGVTDQQPRPYPLEVESVRWVDWEEFVESIGEAKTELSPWAIEEVRELLESAVFRRVYPGRAS
jgi:isopentenyl-diphosphate delta-isomerase